MILILSILLNIGLAYLLVRSERGEHAIEKALDKRGWIKMDDSKRSETWILQGWSNSINKQHTHFDVAFVGNSLTYSSDFQKRFPNVSIINLGVSGSTLRDMLRRMDILKQANPRKVFLMAGSNDLLINTIDEYVADYAALLTAIKSQLPNVRIYVQSMLPMNEKAGRKQVAPHDIVNANERIKALAEENDAVYIDLYSQYAVADSLPLQFTDDGLHLNSEAYNIWATTISKFIFE